MAGTLYGRVSQRDTYYYTKRLLSESILMSPNPESITIDSTSKLFEYEKISREVDNCDDTEVLKNMLKCYVKLYLKQQETVSGFLKGVPTIPAVHIKDES